MRKINDLARYYVDMLVKLGLLRFTLLLATALVILATVVQVGVTLVLRGEIENIDLVRSLFFGLLITPWAVYFLSLVVEQQEDSKRRLAEVVSKLETMRQRDAQLNKKLSEQSALLTAFLDASPDVVYYRNEDRTYSNCNRAVELLTGLSRDKLIGITAEEVYKPETAAKIKETDDAVFRNNMPLSYEQWFEYPDGRKACFELRKVPFYDPQGVRHGLMGFGRDITERKRYQEALERASREKTTFISTISHELRTPLNGIVGLSRILLDTKLEEEQRNYLKTVHISAVTLGHIFNDVIEMDKLERKKLELFNHPVNLNQFLSDLSNMSGLLAQQKGLSFELLPKEPLPEHIMADDARLRQILWNLIGNAVKFTSEGGIKVYVSYESNESLSFTVEDTGRGIPQSEHDKIFAMYYQVEDSKGGRPSTGTGIGLSVSKQLANRMGGDISVKTAKNGHGASFTLIIKAPSMDIHVDNEVNDVMPLPALNILLVEDIELNVVVARSLLEKIGSTVDVAMTGQEALSQFEPDEYDLVLLDIQLPDMTGFDIARELHKRYSKDQLPPLIALTANVLRNKNEYFDAGMDDVLSKPLSVNALTDMIKHYWHCDLDNEVAESPIIEDAIMDETLSDKQFDTNTIDQYMDLMGPILILQNLEMFERLMPNYIALLKSNLTAKDKKGVVEEGHKIKGAAGSVGLKAMQQLAQKIQSPELPAWWDNVPDWIDELSEQWHEDLNLLRAWVKHQLP